MIAVRAGLALVMFAAAFAVHADDIVVKTVPARHYLYSRHPIASVDEVTRVEWAYGPKIAKKARALGLEEAGGLEYHVVLREPMHVDVAMPIARIPPDGDASLYKTTVPFECLAYVHTGSPLDLAEPWARLQREVTARGYAPSAETREIIVSREGYDASRHVTELQAGVVRDGAATKPGGKPDGR